MPAFKNGIEISYEWFASYMMDCKDSTQEKAREQYEIMCQQATDGETVEYFLGKEVAGELARYMQS